MTSKNSFYKRLKEDGRSRLWVPALAMVVHLVLLIVTALILQNMYLPSMTPGDIADSILGFFTGNVWPTLVAVVGAMICGMEGFIYLHHRAENDFYHSLPISRDGLFAIRWTGGLLYYLIPSLIFHVLAALAMILMAGSSAGTGFAGMAFAAAADSFIRNLAVFLLVYHLMILAVMLTGQPVVALLGFGVFMGYAYMVIQLIPDYVEMLFTSYTNYAADLVERLLCLSPFEVCFCVGVLGSPSVPIIIAALVMIVLSLVLSLRLYRIRPSEACSAAVIYPRLRPVIRILITIPGALYCALVFMVLGPEELRFVWAAVGAVLASVIIHGIIQIIYTGDIRKALTCKGQLLACIVLALAVAELFVIDPLDMDHRLPDQSQVAYAACVTWLGDEQIYYEEEALAAYAEGENAYPWAAADLDYNLTHHPLTGQQLEKLYDLLETGLALEEGDEDGSYGCGIEVCFVNQWGFREERHFALVLPEQLETLETLLDDPEFKAGYYPIESLDPAWYYSLTFTDTAGESFTDDFSQEEIADFVALYNEELLAFDVQEICESGTAGSFTTCLGPDSYGEAFALGEYVIPSCFTKSLAWLSDHGIDLEDWPDRVTVSSAMLYDKETYLAWTYAFTEGDAVPEGQSAEPETLGTLLQGAHSLDETWYDAIMVLPETCPDSYGHVLEISYTLNGSGHSFTRYLLVE